MRDAGCHDRTAAVLQVREPAEEVGPCALMLYTPHAAAKPATGRVAELRAAVAVTQRGLQVQGRDEFRPEPERGAGRGRCRGAQLRQPCWRNSPGREDPRHPCIHRRAAQCAAGAGGPAPILHAMSSGSSPLHFPVACPVSRLGSMPSGSALAGNDGCPAHARAACSARWTRSGAMAASSPSASRS
jgi:hypothetical protein